MAPSSSLYTLYTVGAHTWSTWDTPQIGLLLPRSSSLYTPTSWERKTWEGGTPGGSFGGPFGGRGYTKQYIIRAFFENAKDDVVTWALGKNSDGGHFYHFFCILYRVFAIFGHFGPPKTHFLYPPKPPLLLPHTSAYRR